MSIQDLLIRRHRKSERGRWRENGKVFVKEERERRRNEEGGERGEEEWVIENPFFFTCLKII